MSCFICKRCGACCSNYLPLTQKEIKQLIEIVKSRKLKPVKRLFEADYYSTCPFLDNNNNCIIYEDRPNICYSYTCDRFKRNDYNGVMLDLDEPHRLVDLRKEVFNAKME